MPAFDSASLTHPNCKRARKKYSYFKGPVLGIEVEHIAEACQEMIAQGFEFISEIESTEDGQVSWASFIGPDGYLYSLHEHYK